MAGIEDIPVHQYSDLDHGSVWNTIRENIPELKKKIRQLFIFPFDPSLAGRGHGL